MRSERANSKRTTAEISANDNDNESEDFETESQRDLIWSVRQKMEDHKLALWSSGVGSG